MDNLREERVLLVEGNDELHVITKLLERHDVPKLFDIEPKDGFSELHASIYNEINAPQRRVLGILADANDHPDRRWESIRGQLREAGCQVPHQLTSQGTVFSGPRDTRVGVWLMPDNTNAGELEDFVVGMIPIDDAVWPRAKKFIDEIPESELRFKPGKVTRAYVHAWLATRERPRPMGSAITAGDLRHDFPNAASFVQWLRTLFSR